MSGRSGKIASTCLTPLWTAPRYAGLSLAGFIVMTLAAGESSEARAIIRDQIPAAAAPPEGSSGSIDAAASSEPWLLLYGRGSGGEFFLAQSRPEGSFPGTVICTEGGECVGISFPHPTDDGTPPEDGGVPPQAGQPSLTTPDLLESKPRVAPDLEGRFSNGGNEEIW